MKPIDLFARLERLNAIGIALSAEHEPKRLLEMILLGAKELTNADGGTLYTLEDDKLKFEILHNDSLGIRMGGTTGLEVPFEPLPLYLVNNKPNNSMVAAYSVLHAKTVNIVDAYGKGEFDFSGTHQFDKKMGYRSQSFLTVPMRNNEGEVIGLLQLINAIDDQTGMIVPFSEAFQHLAESLASQAAMALTNQNLIQQLKHLFESFIKIIADAIDEKSPYTGGHCQRVPELTMMIAEAAVSAKTGPLQNFFMNEKELYELKIAAWLHDCGKVTTPEYVMDKATKLETIFDRIHLIDHRFELLKVQRENSVLHDALVNAGSKTPIPIKHINQQINVIKKRLDDDKNFIRRVNFGTEFMLAEDIQRIRNIANYEFTSDSGHNVKFLTDDEVYNLTVERGTLTPEERKVINNHIVVTINMLNALPYPKDLARVPEYAGGHHERMNGTGYPKGLTRNEMSIPARIMGVADIFEALTSNDRPYKKAKTMSETLMLLGQMKLDNHIDPDIFDLFIREKIYLKYAEKFLEPEQIDHVDIDSIPGYAA
jgi:HD-GYP domain-containing protein (c-di-GMP phosphodiesterase class II)